MYDPQKRLFIFEKFCELKNGTLVQRAFRTKYKNDKAHSLSTIKYIVQATRKNIEGNMAPKRTRTRPVRTDDLVETLRKLNLEDRSLSTRKAARMVQASRETIRKVYREELNFKPYKKKKTFRLLQTDKPKREKLAQFILKNSNTRRNILDWLIVSDEGYFQLTPGVNSQNDRIWAESQPNVQEEQPLYDQKILVWCAFSKNHTYGPYFFEDKVNGENYLDMLQNYFWKEHTKVKDSQWYYFQQDGAPGDIAKAVQDWLKSKFGERFLDKKSWPPRSPDLNPCDFSVWGDMKNRVYDPKPSNLAELRQNVEREFKKFKKIDKKSIFDNMKKRSQLVLSENGGHIEHLLK